MTYRDANSSDKELFDSFATHPLQTYEWGEFREKTGIKVIRRISETDAYQLTIHPLPLLPFTIGYLPRGNMPTEEQLADLKVLGEREKCLYIQLEPNIFKTQLVTQNLGLRTTLRKSHHPLFAPNTFILDLTRTEEELLKNMHNKTRYNISVAKKYQIEVIEDNSSEAFQTYLALTKETADRQKFYAHSPSYHENQWETLPHTTQPDTLSSHLFIATYTPEKKPIHLTAWIVFIFKDTLYYPYGASSDLYRETMASTQMMWEVIKFGKKHNLKIFDMWGAADTEEPINTDPYFGFHRFKKNFGAVYTSLIGSFDLVISPLYYPFTLLNTLRWKLIKR